MTDKDQEKIMSDQDVLDWFLTSTWKVKAKQNETCFETDTRKKMYSDTGDFYNGEASYGKKVQGFNFDKVVEERLEKTKHLMLVKSKEYVRDDNPFHNFDRGAEYTGETPEDYLYGLMTKHLVSIKDMVDDLYEGKEPSVIHVEEKIGDALLYVMLLEGLFKRRIL